MLRDGIREKPLRYRVLITEDEDGQFVAECPISEEIVEVTIWANEG
jgi:hypothetical protein